MSDLVAALHAELAAIHGIKPGHSLTGDYAALRGDAERLARVARENTPADERLLRDRANQRVRETEAELGAVIEAIDHIHSTERAGPDSQPYCTECWKPHPCATRQAVEHAQE